MLGKEKELNFGHANLETPLDQKQTLDEYMSLKLRGEALNCRYEFENHQLMDGI